MNTHILHEPDMERIIRYLSDGELVVLPTETVYGLGVRCDDSVAVEKVFRAKGRPQDNPLIVHVSSVDMARRYADLDNTAERLFRCFSPGPLTLVLPARETVAENVRAGLDTVALRIPAHELTRRIIEAAGVGLAAPSANRSGRPSPTSAASALEEMRGRVKAVVDGGPATLGIESTVAVANAQGVQVLRPGRITREQLCECLGLKTSDTNPDASEEVADSDSRLVDPTVSPGTRHRHYHPNVRVVVVSEPSELESGPPPTLSDGLLCVSSEMVEVYLQSGGSLDSVRQADGTESFEHDLYEWFFWAERCSFERLFVELPALSAGTRGLRDRIMRASDQSPV
jgi:L-threonylcarbamoyladenylate synthase